MPEGKHRIIEISIERQVSKPESRVCTPAHNLVALLITAENQVVAVLGLETRPKSEAGLEPARCGLSALFTTISSISAFTFGYSLSHHRWYRTIRSGIPTSAFTLTWCWLTGRTFNAPYHKVSISDVPPENAGSPAGVDKTFSTGGYIYAPGISSPSSHT